MFLRIKAKSTQKRTMTNLSATLLLFIILKTTFILVLIIIRALRNAGKSRVAAIK